MVAAAVDRVSPTLPEIYGVDRGGKRSEKCAPMVCVCVILLLLLLKSHRVYKKSTDRCQRQQKKNGFINDILFSRLLLSFSLIIYLFISILAFFLLCFSIYFEKKRKNNNTLLWLIKIAIKDVNGNCCHLLLSSVSLFDFKRWFDACIFDHYVPLDGAPVASESEMDTWRW